MTADDGGGITFTRLHASPDGETHLDDVAVDTTPESVGPGLPGRARGAPVAVTDWTMLRMEPGYFNDWHPAPRRQFVIVCSGELEITTSAGETRPFGPGSVFLAEDTSGKGHQTRAVGASGCILVFVACG